VRVGVAPHPQPDFSGSPNFPTTSNRQMTGLPFLTLTANRFSSFFVSMKLLGARRPGRPLPGTGLPCRPFGPVHVCVPLGLGAKVGEMLRVVSIHFLQHRPHPGTDDSRRRLGLHAGARLVERRRIRRRGCPREHTGLA
jgi:hypothetical protein